MSHRASVALAAVLTVLCAACTADASPLSPPPSPLIAATPESAPAIVVTADVTSARAAVGKGIRTRVSLHLRGNRHGAPRDLTFTLLGGRRGTTTLTPSLWPLWTKGMRVRLTLNRALGRWTLAEAQQIKANASWVALRTPPWSVDDFPMVLHPEAGTPGWAIEAARYGLNWWTQDAGSWADVSVGGQSAAPAPAIDDCGTESTNAESTIAVRSLRGWNAANGADAVGLAYSCGFGRQRTSHVYLDPWLANNFDLQGEVAAHEIGHGLGLAHSPYPWTVMYAYAHTTSGLDIDDINGLRALYPGPFAAKLSSPQAENGTVALRMNPGATRAVPVSMRVAGDGTCDPAVMLGSITEGSGLISPAPGFINGSSQTAWSTTSGRTCTSTIGVTLPGNASGSVRATLAPATFGTSAPPNSGLNIDITVNAPPSVGLTTTRVEWETGRHLFEAKFQDDGDEPFVPTLGRLEWDLNADGTFGDAVEVVELRDSREEHFEQIRQTFPTPGPHAVAVRFTDSEGLSATAQLVVDGAHPQAPKVIVDYYPPLSTTPTTPTPTPVPTPAATTPAVLKDSITVECASEEAQLAAWTDKVKARRARMRRSAAAKARHPSSAAGKRRAAADRRSWSTAVNHRTRASKALRDCLKS